MLTKLFNAAVLVKDFAVDTMVAPLDAYYDFKKIIAGNYSRMPGKHDGLLSTISASATSATIFTGATTLTWIGLLGASMSPVGLGVTGIVVGCAATGAMGRACWAIANRNVPADKKETSQTYADTVVSFKRLMA